ncbi:hypothetical protein FHS10_005071 [Mucilaginibacter dorajii]|nr:hypothetical protein [Mucilaginibacter dorajii]MCS3737102.1 hypothetical protein [Mucilaginibacter dorajii]
MANSKQIRPEWVPSAYQEKDEALKKQVIVKMDGENGLVKKGLNRPLRRMTKHGR